MINFFGDFFIKKSLTPFIDEYFEKIDPTLNQADFNVANFEGSINDNLPRVFNPIQFPFALAMDKQVCEKLKKHHIDFVTRANNHSMDFGEKSMELTSQCLKKNGVSFAGIGKNKQESMTPMVIEKNNIKIAIFSFTTTLPKDAWAQKNTPGVAAPNESELKKILKKYEDSFDFIVVIFHWGIELNPYVSQRNRNFAKIFIKSNGDLILGHHAHIAQQIEKIDHRWVGYGLGNFIFTTRKRLSQLSLGERVQFCASKQSTEKSTYIQFFPLNTDTLNNNFKTTRMSENEFQVILKKYQEKKLFPKDISFIYENKAPSK